jgi:glycosyltransferase involved in cell wall biosynthesis
MFPDAPIFTSQFRENSTLNFFKNREIKTGWLNIFPRFLRKFISPLRYFYFSHLNLREYDLVISICNAEAKNLSRKNLAKNAVHISYLQGPPTQYYWGLYDEYMKNPGFGKLNFLARFGLKILAGKMRKVDFAAAQKPDFLLANSNYVREEIAKYYKRKSEVLWPNVDTENLAKVVAKISEKDSQKLREKLFSRDSAAEESREDFFIISGRQVSWKRIDLAIEACAKIGANLLVIGDGAEHEKLVKLAGESPRIKFLPRYNGAAEIAKYFAAAQAFIFPSLEPFGIAPVEALACGCPVVAFSGGGSRDFIREGENGVFFAKQNTGDLADALRKISRIKFDKIAIQNSAKRFSGENFVKNFDKILAEKIDEK